MSTKNQKTKRKIRVEIIVAVVGLIGTLIAALIGILPNINIFEARPSATTTPTVFVKYDDPLGVFSFEMPPNFFVSLREKSDEMLRVEFMPIEAKDIDKQISKFGSLDVMLFRSEIIPADKKEYDEFINDYILRFMKKEYEGRELITITNKKTEKGFLVNFKLMNDNPDESAMTIYTLIESDQTAVLIISFFVVEDSMPYYKTSIDHVFSSLSWSPSAVANYFSLPK